MSPLFGIGDKVRIVKYGSKMIIHPSHLKYFAKAKRIKGNIYDNHPELIGMVGIIKEVSMTHDTPTYAIDGIPEKCAWYDEDQLEMVNPNPNVH